VLGQKGSTEILKHTNLTKGKIYDQNSSLDVNKDGILTVGDVMAKNEKRVGQAPGPVELPDVPLAGLPASEWRSPSLPPPWRSSGAPSDLPVLRVGSKGTAVAMAQMLLGSDVITGVFTEAFAIDYVRAFQKLEGLTSDAVIGPLTWQAMADALKERPTEIPPPESSALKVPV